jgi:hypothetical protein
MRGRFLGYVVLAILVALAVGGFLLARGWLGGDDDAPPKTEGPVRVLPDSEVVRDRPTTARTLGKRLTTRRARPRVALSAGTPDTALATRYGRLANEAAHLRRFRDSVERARAAGDTAAHPERVPVPKSILPPAQGRYDGKRLLLWAVKSDGRNARAEARLGWFDPRWSFTMGMDRISDSIPVIDVDRWFVALARQGWKCAPVTGLAGLGGAVVEPGDRLGGALLAGGLVLLGCILG